MIADHCPGFATVELPHGQYAVGARFAAGDERFDDVAVRRVGLNKRQQRMLRAEGVPQRKGRAEGEILCAVDRVVGAAIARSEEHTSELQSLMRISYAVFCLKKKK